MLRANRVTVQTTKDGYKATFYKTHTLVGVIESNETDWQADENANSTTNRESFREYICRNAECHDIEWLPNKQKQAWNRQFDKYMTDKEVAVDTVTLVSDALYRLAEKSRYNMVISSISVDAILPKKTDLTYVEDGRYIKSGAWCMADIELELDVLIGEHSMRMIYNVEMKSGQICKPKTTIAEWNEIVAREMELNGIEYEYNKESNDKE